jgi:RHS repeat-associated protein
MVETSERPWLLPRSSRIEFGIEFGTATIFPKRRASPDSGNTDTVYDARGLATQVTDGRGVVTNMTYDAAGRLLTKTYPAATAENVTYTYDDVTAGNKGKGRLTRIASQNVIIDRVYDVRGNIVTDTRTIAGLVHTTAYLYDAADRITQITYPSGRIVNYVRDTTGRITSATTKQNAAAAVVTLASGIIRQPHTNVVQSLVYGNGLNDWNTFTNDTEQDLLQVYDGATPIINRAHTRTDNLNLTGITDAVTPANNETLAYSAANRLTNASATGAGAYGTRVWAYDAVGNRTSEVSTPVGGAATTRTFTVPATSNKPSAVMIGAATDRAFVYDAGGNLTSDTRSGTAYDYAYNIRNRMSTATVGGVLKGTYTYNGLEQLAIRVTSNMTPSGTTHFIHDLAGNVIAEADGAAAVATTVREYIYLPETEIAPTYQSRAQVDRPLAVVNAVNTTPVTWYVHVDHLNRPIKMTDAAKASVWDAVWQPWGNAHTITGTAVLDARFPGQWFQLETGLHYNWNRHYDPTIGRFTQADPLGFVNGPSVFAYAASAPLIITDPSGEFWNLPLQYCARYPAACSAVLACVRNPKSCSEPMCRATKGVYKAVCSTPRCSMADSCEMAKVKAAAHVTCYAARAAYTMCGKDTGGGDDGHEIQMTQALTGVEKCANVIQNKCGICVSLPKL